jgi:hypothetical protein
MNSYNLGAMSGTYTTGLGGYNAEPRKANVETEDAPQNSTKKLETLRKEFRDENFNTQTVAGLTATGLVLGIAADARTGGFHPVSEGLSFLIGEEMPGKWSYIGTGIALAGGLLWEKMRSDGAKKHNTELLAKLRTEESGGKEV